MKYVLTFIIATTTLGLTSCALEDPLNAVSRTVVGVPITRRSQPLQRQTNEYDVMIHESRMRQLERRGMSGGASQRIMERRGY